VSRDRERIEERQTDHGTIRFFVSEQGTRYTHHECERRFKASVYNMMRWCSRAIRTRTDWNDEGDPSGAVMRAHELQELRWRLGDITAYVEHVQRELDKIEGADRKAERIKALREVAGREPGEAALFLAKADELERASS
jgi:hypothetical protein